MRINAKGQVTIPRDIRERLGLVPQSEVEFQVKGDGLTLRKAKHGNAGRLLVEHIRASRPKMIMSGKELLALLRDEPDEIPPH